MLSQPAAIVYAARYSTGLNVQGWLADDPSGDEDGVYETVTCLACTRVHLINRATGEVLGDDDE
jgi:hypothetical protein